MPALSRNEILARKVHGETARVPIDDQGGYVVVRGLTRGEAHETVGKSTREAEVIAIAAGLIEPAMDRADVEVWLDNEESGIIDLVIKQIQHLSGEWRGAGKEYTKSVPGGESDTSS